MLALLRMSWAVIVGWDEQLSPIRVQHIPAMLLSREHMGSQCKAWA